MAQDCEEEKVFASTVRLRCDFPGCKDARDRRDYSATTMEEHMANHFISLRPQLKQYIHQYPCSCGHFFSTQYHFTVHLYQNDKQTHYPLPVQAQWTDRRFLDAQSHFHTRFYPLYVAYAPFPKDREFKLYAGYPIPERVTNNEETTPYDRSKRCSTPGNATPGSFNLSRHTSPAPTRRNSSNGQSPFHRGATPVSTQRDEPRWNRESSRQRHTNSDQRESRRDSYHSGSRRREDDSRSRNMPRDNSNYEPLGTSRAPPVESYTSPASIPPPVSNPPEPVQQEFSKPFDEKEFLQAFKRRFPCTNVKSSPLTILDKKPTIKISLKLNSNVAISDDSEKGNDVETKPKDRELLPIQSSSFLSKINTKKRKAPSPPTDSADKNRPLNKSFSHFVPDYGASSDRVSKSNASTNSYQENSVGLFGQKNISDSPNATPAVQANPYLMVEKNEGKSSPEPTSLGLSLGQSENDKLTNQPITEDLDAGRMFDEDNDQQEILVRNNTRSSYMPLRSNTQRHTVPSANLTADDVNKISSFRPKSGRPEKPKMVANPPFMDIVPNQGSREGRRSRSRSATPSRARSRSNSRGPSRAKSPKHRERQSRSFARHALKNNS